MGEMSKLRKIIKRCVISQCRRGTLVTYMILYCVWILKKITTIFAAPCITLWRSKGGIKCRPFGSTRNMGGSGASPGKFSCCRLSVSCFGVYLSTQQTQDVVPTLYQRWTPTSDRRRVLVGFESFLDVGFRRLYNVGI